MKIIYDIFDEVVNSMRETVNFTTVENLTANQRKIICQTELTFKDDYIHFDLDNFDAKVLEVAENYIIVQTTKTITENGTFANYMPQFDYEYFDFEARKLANKNMSEEKFKKFPLIFLDLNFEEKKEKEFRIIAPTIYIIGKTEEAWDMRTRNINSFPQLRIIFETFLTKLKTSKYTYNIGNYTYKELPYRENNLNAVVDAIQVKFDEIKLNCN